MLTRFDTNSNDSCHVNKINELVEKKENINKETKTDNLKTFACSYPNCERTYTNKPRLQIHLRTHTGEKPFKCDQCPKAFNEKGNLKVHLRIHTGEMPYKCTFELCDKEFKAYGHLSDHLKRHLNIKAFTCEICEAKFSRKNTLKTHIMIHNEEKPFSCEFESCQRKFNEKGNLKTHLKTHTKQEKQNIDFKNLENMLIKNFGLSNIEDLYSKTIEQTFNKKESSLSLNYSENTDVNSSKFESNSNVISFYDLNSDKSWYERENNNDDYLSLLN